MNFGNCCIHARKAHTSIRKFSKENLTVKVSGVIVRRSPYTYEISHRRKATAKNIFHAVALITHLKHIEQCSKSSYTDAYDTR